MTIRKLIADDHELAREGLPAAFEQTDIVVAGEASTCEEAIHFSGSGIGS